MSETYKIFAGDPFWGAADADGLVPETELRVPARKKDRYDEAYAEQAEKLCLLLGATDNDLALFFGVSMRTITRWRTAHPNFAKAVKRGKLVADSKVAESLYRMATGFFSVKKQKVFGDAKSGGHFVVDYEEEQLPNVAAGIFWLKNRQPEQWRDRPKTEVGDLESMTDEQLAEIAAGRTPTGKS